MSSKRGDCQLLGLINKNGTTVPLKEINVSINVIGFVAEVTSILLYSNNEDNPIEAEFTFPVDDGSAVFSFEAEIEGRHIVAEIQEKEQAMLTYQDAIDKGSTALLLKEDDSAGDIFQCSLGNLPPKTEAKISFSYVIELPQEPDGKIRFTLPTVLNPRYSPVGGPVAAKGATYTAPVKIPYKFTMNADVRGYRKVLAVTSNSDKLKVKRIEHSAISVCLADEFKFDHDLSFLIEYDKCYKPQMVLETGVPEAEGMMKEDLVMVNFYPELDETKTIGEYIFVIDRSGSMDGHKMTNAKDALLLFLKSLPVDCYFNIISFGSDYSALFKMGSSKYSESNLKDALSLQSEMKANMGGTGIFEPFSHIFSKDVIKGHPRQIFLLTDGQVSNTDQLIGLVKRNAHNSRVFTLGIGSGVSTSLIKGVARAGNGKSEFIADKDRIQPKVISLLKCATQPTVSNIELSWDLPQDITAVPIPKEPPTFIAVGERLCLYALLTGGKLESSNRKYGVKLTGMCGGKRVKYKMCFSKLQANKENPSSPLHRLAAKTQIKLLELEDAAYNNADNGRVKGGLEPLDKVRSNIKFVSICSNIVSKMTAFVAIDKEARKKVKGEMVKRPCRIPVATQEFTEAYLQNRSNRSIRIPLCAHDEYEPFMMPRCMPTRTCRTVTPIHNEEALIYADVMESENANYIPFGDMAMNEYESYESADTLPRQRIYYHRCASDVRKPSNIYAKTSRRHQIKTHEPSNDVYSQVQKPTKKDKLESTGMLAMIELQEIDGNWVFSERVTSLLGVNGEDIKAIDDKKKIDVLTTVAVIVWLRTAYIDIFDEWEMIEKKALAWLRNLIKDKNDLDTLMDKTREKLWPDEPKNCRESLITYL